MKQQIDDPLKRATIFLSENAIRQNSWSRTICYLFVDLLLLVGFIWHIYITDRDWNYWKAAPNSFNVFLVIQYLLLALCIRFPVTTMFKQNTITKGTLLLGLCLLINTIIGTVWFFELTDPQKKEALAAGTGRKPFDLKDEYLAHGIIMILIPWSIFCFLLIVLVKVICFFFAESKKRN